MRSLELRVFYVDTGLASEVGHHATVCRLITRALRDCGHNVVVAAWQGLEQSLQIEFSARPVFRVNTYWRPDEDPICGWLVSHFVTSHATTEDFALLGPIMADDLLYVNSVMPAQLIAVYNFLGQLSDDNRPQTFVELGTDPGVEFVVGSNGVTLSARDPRADARATLYRFTARQMATRQLQELHLVTFDPTSSHVYTTLLGTPVEVLPLPYVGTFDRRDRRSETGPRTVAFLGHQRGEKGYHLVPEIAKLLLSSRDDVRLLIHNARPDDMSEVQRIMRLLAASDPRIELDERPAGPDIWRALLRRSDVIVCPYMPDRYRAAYSGVTADAIASGVPLVVPEQTGMSRMVHDYHGGGTSFAEHEPTSIVSAISQLLSNFSFYAERAAAAAVRWTETMGPHRMVGTMLERIARIKQLG
jgi:glycosyltransferase involved in cell wall biosynthesis